MANNNRTRTTFGPDNQPEKRRGKSFRTLALNALKSNNISEDEFVKSLCNKAISEGGIYYTEFIKRFYPPEKPTSPLIEFDFNPDWTPVEKATSILNQVANGEIAPDVGLMLIESVSRLLGIQDITEFAERLATVEGKLNIGDCSTGDE